MLFMLIYQVCAESLQRMCRRDAGDHSGSDSDSDDNDEGGDSGGDNADDSFLSEQSDSPLRSAGLHSHHKGLYCKLHCGTYIDYACYHLHDINATFSSLTCHSSLNFVI